MLSEMIERGRLKVVALYPDEDLAEWREYRGHIPPSWINGYDAGCVVREKSLYDLHAIPALYLLDRDKRVLVKDSPTCLISRRLSTAGADYKQGLSFYKKRQSFLYANFAPNRYLCTTQTEYKQ